MSKCSRCECVAVAVFPVLMGDGIDDIILVCEPCREAAKQIERIQGFVRGRVMVLEVQ